MTLPSLLPRRTQSEHGLVQRLRTSDLLSEALA